MLVALCLLITGCPSPAPRLPVDTTIFTSPTPSPTDPGSLVAGTLYSYETGQPIPQAIVILDNETQVLTGMDGAFTATRSTDTQDPSITVLKSGFANLTVHGYQGGALTMPGRSAASPMATQSMTVFLTAPEGATTTALLSLAVKSESYAYARTEFLGSVPLSAAGTGSVKVGVPAGHVTAIAYGTTGEVVGVKQGAVSGEMEVSLAPASAFETYQTEVSLPRADGSLLSEVSYFLNWPGDTPARPNSALVAEITGSSTVIPFILPPPSSFGIPGAYYSVVGSALRNTISRPSIAFRRKGNVAPGSHSISLLGEAIWVSYRAGSDLLEVPFRPVLDSLIPGANAHYADINALLSAGGGRLWKVVALGTSTASLDVPVLPRDLRATYGLTVDATYSVTVGAAINPVSVDAEYAQTMGLSGTAVYNRRH